LTAGERPPRWSGLIVSLHWVAAAIILALLAMGWAMVYGGLDAPTTFDLFQWHKSLGFTALALTAARVAARFVAPSPAAPLSPRWERLLAAFVQYALYLLTIIALLSGWLAVSTSPLPIPSRFFDLFVVPNIAGPNPAVYGATARAHAVAAWTIAALVVLHAAGALKHHLVNRDDVLRRMSPNWPKPGASRR
jgi:cytochrome b561